MENELIIAKDEEIKNLIYTVRGRQVMLDSDVAKLYNYKTKSLNLAVKRNIERFPENFCFQLTEKEIANLRFQIETSSLKKGNYGGRRYLPYAFTEYGITMLAGLLKSEIAINISIKIVNAFVEMRKFISSNGQMFERMTKVEYKLLEHDKKFDKIFNELGRDKTEFKQKIFFEGQIYDSYSLIISIIQKATEKIVIIDNYIDNSILDILTKKNNDVETMIFTSKNNKITKLDIKKFNEEYPILKIIETTKFHDRFIIIDNKELYHLGASIKDLGKKCFAISKMIDENILNNLNQELKLVANCSLK